MRFKMDALWNSKSIEILQTCLPDEYLGLRLTWFFDDNLLLLILLYWTFWII